MWPLYAAGFTTAFGAHGIAWDGQGAFYVNNYNASRLVRVPINADGHAGVATEIAVIVMLSSENIRICL